MLKHSGKLMVMPFDPGRSRRLKLIVGGLWLASLSAAYLISRAITVPAYARANADLASKESQLGLLQLELERGKDNLAVHERGEQVAKAANAEMQAALSAKVDEIAQLKLEISFYQRMASFAGGQEGLNIFSVCARPAGQPNAYTITITPVQNLKHADLVNGKASLSISGALDGKMQRYGLKELTGGTESLPFALKFFQNVQTQILLPAGFVPQTIGVSLNADSGAKIDREFGWKQSQPSASGDGLCGSV
jgi:hypothetical protein